MKKVIFTLAMALLTMVSAVAQEKGSYLTVSGNLGATKFGFQMDNDRWSNAGIGFGGAVGYQYFFNRYVGIGTGVGLHRYNSYATYNNSFENSADYQYDGMRDDDIDGRPRDYNLQLRLNNWRERQEAWFLEIPVMFVAQTKWGAKQRHGMYFGIGAKFQLPVFGQHYSVRSGNMDALGYYPEPNLTLGDNGDPSVLHHGFGNKDAKDLKELDQFKEGDLDLKFGVAGTMELGFLFGLSRRVDLTIGAYLDYGFMDINKGNKNEGGRLIDVDVPNHANNIGENMTYNGIINSNVVVDGKVNPMALGGKIGLRIKLGKLAEQKVEDEEEEPVQLVVEEEEEEKEEAPVEPVVTVEPVVVEDPGITEAELAILSEPIFFDLAKADLKAPAVMALDRKVQILNKYPEVSILILGNTCDLGNDNINIPLGQKRAEAARNYLESKGISLVRMSTVTQAASHPIVPNTNEENRSKNRRDDFVPNGY